MRETIVKIICDRCGLVITGDPVKITPHFIQRNTEEPYDWDKERNVPEWMKRMMDKEFCPECAQRILDISMIRE